MLMQVTRHSKTLRMPLGIGHKQNRKLREVDVFWGKCLLVGGFNPFEKCYSNWIISPARGENKKHLKPPPSLVIL